MKKHLVGALCVCSLIAGAACAAPVVQPGTYALETTHTEVLFGIDHMGFSTFYGEFPGSTGTLVVNGANPLASQLDVSTPIAGVMTSSAKLNEELRSAQWLDAGKYPSMTFHSTRITPTGPDTADVAGDLTLHGVTKPVVLHARFKRAGDAPMMHAYMAGFEVSGEIRRSDFGVSNYIPILGDEVHLIISAPFVRKGP
ncbi:MAG: polyisoprenoid-binding protein [Caulobacteraceae bacterium]|nr:polyisoprenoid-binding protein [Caulobacteraceae bacterium]